MTEQYPNRSFLELRRNDGQPGTIPPIFQVGTGLWTPNQASMLTSMPSIISVNAMRSSLTRTAPSFNPGRNAQINYPVIPNTQYVPPNFNPAGYQNLTNPQGNQQLLPPIQHSERTTSTITQLPDRPLTQEEWDILPASARARIREQQDIDTAKRASIEDQLQIEAIVRSYPMRQPTFQANSYSNNPYNQRNDNTQSQSGHGQSGQRPQSGNQSSSIRPVGSSDIMCAFCRVKEAVYQHPLILGGIRMCEPCFTEIHRAERGRPG